MLGHSCPVTIKGSSVVLSGATSGLGLALARELMSRGVKTLGVMGRKREVLETLRAEGAVRGVTVLTLTIDFNKDASTVQESLSEFMSKLASVQLPDLVIACAGVSTTRCADGLEDLFEIRRALAVNVLAALSLLYLGAACMVRRGQGRLCVISSLASLVTMESSALYGATKCALNSYAAALRCSVQSRGVGVTRVVPGFIESPMSARFKGRRPFMVSAQYAALRIVNALERGQDELCFPYLLYAGLRLLSFLPSSVRRAILKSFAFEVAPDAERQAYTDSCNAGNSLQAASGKEPLGMLPDVCTETNFKVETLRRSS